MLSQRVVWTLLPNGLDAAPGMLKASILVSPRLKVDGPDKPALSSFPAWRHWIETLAGATFKVTRSDGKPDLPVTVTSATRADIWDAIFTDKTYVRPWKFDETKLVGRTILSYSVSAVEDLIDRIYGQAALVTPDLPVRRELGSFVHGELLRGDRQTSSHTRTYKPLAPKDVLKRLRGETAQNGRNANDDTRKIGLRADPRYALDLLQAYHAPLSAPVVDQYPDDAAPDGYKARFPGTPPPYRNARWDSAKRAPLTDESHFKEDIDFHRIVAALVQYPALARVCGLVIDVTFPTPPAPDPNLALALKASWSGGAVPKEPDIAPRIAVDLSAGDFIAKQGSASPISGRYLRLADKRYSVVQMDVDGGGLKLKNVANSLATEIPAPYTDELEKGDAKQPDAKTGLPSLRTGGLMLVESRRDVTLSGLLARAEEMQTQVAGGSAPTLHAEDIVRGYRIDVRDATGPETKWHTLYLRDTAFDFVNAPSLSPFKAREEGMARAAAGESIDGANPDILKLHEGIASWSGWSLAAPAPGRLIDADDKVSAPEEKTPEGLPLRTTHKAAPQSLPRLRFGHTYQMRVRLVDLAGNSATPGAGAPKDAISADVVYRRHEPLEPPVLALVSAGGVIDPLDDGESMDRLALRTFNADPDPTVLPPAVGAPRRHVVPARVSQRFAEAHGMFDDPTTGRPLVEEYKRIVDRDPPAAASPIQEKTINRAKPSGPAPERYAVADEKLAAYPFLPDPLAVELVITIDGLPDISPTKQFLVPLYAASARWPDARVFKIVAGEAGGAANFAGFDTSAWAFRVGLRKGEKARLSIRCKIPKTRIESMAVFDMLKRRAAVGDQFPKDYIDNHIRPAIENGDHWMFTPARFVEIVHATQKPLIAPGLPYPMVQRDFGKSVATFLCRKAPAHAKTTGKLDLDAIWREPIDAPGTDAPISQDASGHAFKRDLMRLETPDSVLPLLKGEHQFPDTRARRLVYTATATSRHKEFFAQPIRDSIPAVTRASAPAVAWLPNSAPPPAPSVLYVVPTFGWATSGDAADRRSWRLGGGLRVYLDRPWLSTGFTEMLGVVLPASGATDKQLEGPYQDSATLWGGDPIRPGSGATIPTAAPAATDFPLRWTGGAVDIPGTDLPAEERALPSLPWAVNGLRHPDRLKPTDTPLPVDVVPHEVGFDADRKLWYADIVVRPPNAAYFPFIRLALARYNPMSVPDASLSQIVLADVQQLIADRLVTVQRAANGRSAHVAVYGYGGTPGDFVPPGVGLIAPSNGPVRFDVETQVRDAGSDPELGWRAAKAQPVVAGRFDATAAAAARVAGQVRLPIAPNVGAFTATAPAATPAATPPALSELQIADLKKRVASLGIRDVSFMLQPPLLWETTVDLPTTPAGGARRLLVTETETYAFQPDDLAVTADPPQNPGRRIIYMDALEV